MPIKFRCPHCRQFLGISRSKAKLVTDCPTCGRTIRVPDLDGTVAPLPAPKLNLEDSELRQALGALAALEGVSSDSGDQKIQVGSAQFAHNPQQQVIQKEFIPVVAEAVVQDVPVLLDLQITGAKTEEPAAAQLADIEGLEFAVPILEPEVIAPESRAGWPLLVVCSFLMLILGVFLGRMTASGTAAHSAPSGGDAEENPHQNGNRDVQGEPVLDQQIQNNGVDSNASMIGKVTYETPSGESRADHGARLLLLPLPRRGTSKLPSEGLRVGAVPEDQRLLESAVRTLGGRFALADANGTFRFEGLPPGQYGMLIASRYQARDATLPQGVALLKMMNDYFDQSAHKLGQVEHFYREIDLTANANVPIDYHFSIE